MKLGYDFYHRPCLEVAHDLVGKVLHFRGQSLRITETEAYCGENDTACHAFKGRTPRTEVLYSRAGTAYVYLCYGVHNLLNLVTGEEGEPEAVLIRASEGFPGPGRLTNYLGLTRAENRADVTGDGEPGAEDVGGSRPVARGRRGGLGQRR